MTLILGGLALILVAIWFGAYYVSEHDDWQCVPAFLTAILVAIVGLVMIINGAIGTYAWLSLL